MTFWSNFDKTTLDYISDKLRQTAMLLEPCGLAVGWYDDVQSTVGDELNHVSLAISDFCAGCVPGLRESEILGRLSAEWLRGDRC